MKLAFKTRRALCLLVIPLTLPLLAAENVLKHDLAKLQGKWEFMFRSSLPLLAKKTTC